VLSEPEIYIRLQEELDSAIPDPEEMINDKALLALPYLSAVLEETTRLGSPFHAVPRQVPEGGAVVDGEYIPEGTVISVPSYVMHTAEEYFSPEPESFRPERWLPGGLGPDSYTNKAAVIAFSGGKFVHHMILRA
jgi:cytochrome P450